MSYEVSRAGKSIGTFRTLAEAMRVVSVMPEGSYLIEGPRGRDVRVDPEFARRSQRAHASPRFGKKYCPLCAGPHVHKHGRP